MENETNAGFTKANNQAIAVSESRYLFLLNSDAAILPGAVDSLVAFADEHPEAGILGAKVLNPDGSLQYSCRRFPTLGAGLFRNTYLGRLFPHNKYAQSYLMTDFDHKTVRNVDWVSGCAMFIRRSVLDKIGLLDERFFMYCEDVDICERVWKSGSDVVYVPSAVVTHAIGHSSDKAFERMNKAFHRALYELDKKRYPGFHPIRRPAVRAGLWLRASVRLWKHRAALAHHRKKMANSEPATASDFQPTNAPGKERP
jgi:GT2 family glycosyltransferase